MESYDEDGNFFEGLMVACLFSLDVALLALDVVRLVQAGGLL